MNYRHSWIACAVLFGLASVGNADIYRWDNHKVIPGTEGIQPWPGAQLHDRNLTFARLGGHDLTSASFRSSDLSDAIFNYSTLAGADFTDAIVNGVSFGHTHLTKEQLYSTASYVTKDLRRILLWQIDLNGWDFRGQNLDGASFSDSSVIGGLFSGATLAQASI
jgi:uncharacterized protein YjbI with pentapeptide repeats